MAQEVQAMEDHVPEAVVVAEAVVEATAEAAVILLEEAEDLHATLPVIADHVLVHKVHSNAFFCRLSLYSFPVFIFFFNSTRFIHSCKCVAYHCVIEYLLLNQNIPLLSLVNCILTYVR